MSWYLQMATSVSLADSAAGVQFPAAEGSVFPISATVPPKTPYCCSYVAKLHWSVSFVMNSSYVCRYKRVCCILFYCI